MNRMSGLPVILATDLRQLDRWILGLAALLAVLFCSSLALLRSPTLNALVISLGIMGASLVYCIGWLTFKRVRRDRVIVGAKTLTVSSRFRTREWSWQQIDDVRLDVVTGVRTPTYKLVRLYIPDAGDHFITLPRFLCSDEGLETPDTIYELIRRMLAMAKSSKPRLA